MKKRAEYADVVRTIKERMDKLEEALDISGLDGATFSKFAKILFDNAFARFEKMGAEEIAAFVATVNDGTTAEPRLEWPNAEVVVDAAFVETREWEAIRHFGIGGSDASVIKGISHWGTPQGLYHDKCGTPPLVKEEKPQAVFDRGHFLEDDVVKAFCNITGAHRIPETRMFRSKKYPAVTANPDAIIRMPDGCIFVFEAKTTIDGNWDNWANNKVPPYYITQMRQYPGVLDDDRICGTWIGCLFTHDFITGGVYLGSEFKPEDYVSRCLERDCGAETSLMELEQEWWDTYMTGDIEPDPSGWPDLDLEVLKKYHLGAPDPTTAPVQLPLSMHKDDIETFLEAKKERQILEKKADLLKEKQKDLQRRIVASLGTATIGEVDIDADKYYEIKYVPTSRVMVDMERLKVEFPDVYDAVSYTNPEYSRPFSITEKRTNKKKSLQFLTPAKVS